MPGFSIPKLSNATFPRFDEMNWDELVEFCNTVLDDYADLIQSCDKSADIVRNLRGGKTEGRHWALRQIRNRFRTQQDEQQRLYYGQLRQAVEAALQSPAIDRLHHSVAEDLSVAVIDETMPQKLRRSTTDALEAVYNWELEHEQSAPEGPIAEAFARAKEAETVTDDEPELAAAAA